MIVGADALDLPHRPRPQTGPGPVGDAEIHRHPDEGHLEPAKIRLIGVDLENPQFPKMAESFGVAGVRTTTPEGLGRELAAALKRRGTTLIEVAVGEMPDPRKVIIPPRVRGVR